MGGMVNKALAPPTASRRRCYNQAAHRGQALLTTDARAVQRERAPVAQRRLSVTVGGERDGTARRCGSRAKATGREWRKESARAGARQGRRCRDRRACDRERSWRMVVLGRRIARGGRERGAKPSPPATSGRSRSRSGTPERWPVPLALTKPALACVGALLSMRVLLTTDTLGTAISRLEETCKLRKLTEYGYCRHLRRNDSPPP